MSNDQHNSTDNKKKDEDHQSETVQVQEAIVDYYDDYSLLSEGDSDYDSYNDEDYKPLLDPSLPAHRSESPKVIKKNSIDAVFRRKLQYPQHCTRSVDNVRR